MSAGTSACAPGTTSARIASSDAEEAGLGYGRDEAEEAWLENDRGEH